MANGQGLPQPTQDHFLVGHGPLGADAVDGHPTDLAAPCAGQVHLLRPGQLEGPAPGLNHLLGRCQGSSRWGIDLRLVMPLDDLGVVEEPTGYLRQVYLQYRPQGEVGGDDGPDLPGLAQAVDFGYVLG